MPRLRHAYGEVRALAPNVEETRTIEFVISNNTRDRHGSVIPVDKWALERFNQNGIVGYQHNVYGGDMCNAPDPDQVLGTGRAWIEGDQLIGSVTFEPASINPLAEKIFRKVLFGTLKATSVGFNPTAKTYYGEGDQARGAVNETEYYDGQELLEFSIVNIPSNPDALKRSMRDQASNAIGYIYKQLGGSYRFSEIENMTVRGVIELLEKGKRGIEETEEDKDIKDLEDSKELNETEDSKEVKELEEAQLREADEDLLLITRMKLAVTAN